MTIEEEIRKICTYHSDDGTSGYNLSEEQFRRLVALFDSAKEACSGYKSQAIRKDVRTIRRDLP